jgi:hypothetical protein
MIWRIPTHLVILGSPQCRDFSNHRLKFKQTFETRLSRKRGIIVTFERGSAKGCSRNLAVKPKPGQWFSQLTTPEGHGQIGYTRTRPEKKSADAASRARQMFCAFHKPQYQECEK